ncbi:unnamed protein product, partial [Amoebophrya sp. A120]
VPTKSADNPRSVGGLSSVPMPGTQTNSSTAATSAAHSVGVRGSNLGVKAGQNNLQQQTAWAPAGGGLTSRTTGSSSGPVATPQPLAGIFYAGGALPQGGGGNSKLRSGAGGGGSVHLNHPQVSSSTTNHSTPSGAQRQRNAAAGTSGTGTITTSMMTPSGFHHSVPGMNTVSQGQQSAHQHQDIPAGSNSNDQLLPWSTTTATSTSWSSSRRPGTNSVSGPSPPLQQITSTVVSSVPGKKGAAGVGTAGGNGAIGKGTAGGTTTTGNSATSAAKNAGTSSRAVVGSGTSSTSIRLPPGLVEQNNINSRTPSGGKNAAAHLLHTASGGGNSCASDHGARNNNTTSKKNYNTRPGAGKGTATAGGSKNCIGSPGLLGNTSAAAVSTSGTAHRANAALIHQHQVALASQSRPPSAQSGAPAALTSG